MEILKAKFSPYSYIRFNKLKILNETALKYTKSLEL